MQFQFYLQSLIKNGSPKCATASLRTTKILAKINYQEMGGSIYFWVGNSRGMLSFRVIDWSTDALMVGAITRNDTPGLSGRYREVGRKELFKKN